MRRTRLLTPRIGDDGQGPTLSIYSTIYSPRRGVFKSGPSNGADEEPPGSKKTGRKPALIETKFLPWCCRRFTEPVLHLFDEETGKISNIECTKELPLTDWALETSMAMTEFSEKERRSLKKSARLDKQVKLENACSKIFYLNFVKFKFVLDIRQPKQLHSVVFGILSFTSVDVRR